MRMIAIHAQTERKRLDRSVRCAEKRRPWARKQRLRGLIRPDPAVCATAGAACGRKSLSSARIQAIFTSNDTPLGECRLQRLSMTPANGTASAVMLAPPRLLWELRSIRLDQAVFGAHIRSALTSAFAISMSLRMTTTMATFAGFPTVRRASYLALRSGLNRMATSAGM